MKIACYVLVLLLVDAWSAEAAVLCARKDREGNASGSISVRQECRRNEVRLDPDTVGLQAKGPAVYDANGKQVGEFYSSDNPLQYVNIILRLGQVSLPFNVNRAHIWSTLGATSSTIRFESTDCSGTPFMPASGAILLMPFFAISHPGNTVYLGDDSQSLRTTILPRSERQIVTESAFSPFPCSSISEGPIDAMPLTPLVDLDTLFTPPFSVR